MTIAVRSESGTFAALENTNTVESHEREQFKTARDAGLKARHAKRLARWMPVEEWLKAYDEQRDPDGHYGTPGRNPANILTRAS